MRVLRFRRRGGSIRTLRTLLGLSRLQLAGLTGVSVEQIKSVEIGRRRLTHDFASTISGATGVAMDSLLCESLRMPLKNCFGSALTMDWFQHYGRGLTQKKSELLAPIFEDLSKLTKMAWNQGSLVAFLYRINHLIEEFSLQLGLKEDDRIVISHTLRPDKVGHPTKLKRQRGHQFGGWRKKWERKIPPSLDDLRDED